MTGKTQKIIVWFRNDLRIHDHPALAHAVASSSAVVPVFIFDKKIYAGKYAGSNRNRFLWECLEDLKSSLKKRGADLVVREGNVVDELEKLIKETRATAIYYTADYSPLALRRDKKVNEYFKGFPVEVRAFAGRLILSDPGMVMTKNKTPHKVFTPFYNTWLRVGRRKLVETPKAIPFHASIAVGDVPTIERITRKSELSVNVVKGGETEARKRFVNFVHTKIDRYYDQNNDMAADATSRLSAYLHFGCLSPLELEQQLPDNDGAKSWQRQLAWRDFYHYVLFYNPSNSRLEFQEKYRGLDWGHDMAMFNVWKIGKTGYPIVDAAMRQLNAEGWMHNRGRLIVGSFLTKDLWLDWRLGESYFMQMLVDGDQANNNGNWQWIASVGVDPAPMYRRLFNPVLQQDKFDPTGAYVRRFVPELKRVPDKYLSQPWMRSPEIQYKSKCIIGKDYPVPIVNHAEARQTALERFRLLGS